MGVSAVDSVGVVFVLDGAAAEAVHCVCGSPVREEDNGEWIVI